VKKLAAAGVNTVARASAVRTAGPLAGKSFVLTGTLEEFTRQEAGKIIKNLGGHVVSSVSRKTDYVVVGRDPGQKYDKAINLGVKILRESEFKKLLAECQAGPG
jgi:DNA ligase (NAD+)